MLENPKVAIILPVIKFSVLNALNLKLPKRQHAVMCPQKRRKYKKINTLTARCTFSVKYCVYVSTSKKEVKMAGYWCQSFLSFYGPRRSQDQYPAMPWWN